MTPKTLARIYVAVMLMLATVVGIGLGAVKAPFWLMSAIVVLCFMHYFFGFAGSSKKKDLNTSPESPST